MVSNHGKDATEIERRHSDGGGLLAAGGASRGNMFSGDAPALLGDDERDRATGSAPARASTSPTSPTPTASRARSRSISGTCCSSGGRRAAQRKARRGARRPRRPLPADARRDHGGHARPQRRRRCSATSSRACRSSTRPSSATTRSRTIPASSEPDAFAVLQAARRPARAPRAGGRAGAAPLSPGRALGPRPEPGPAVPAALRRRARGGGTRRAHRRRGLRAAGARRGPELPSAARSPTPATRTAPAGRILARATRDRMVEGEVVLGPNREALEEREVGTASEHDGGRARLRRPRA